MATFFALMLKGGRVKGFDDANLTVSKEAAPYAAHCIVDSFIVSHSCEVLINGDEKGERWSFQCVNYELGSGLPRVMYCQISFFEFKRGRVFTL